MEKDKITDLRLTIPEELDEKYNHSLVKVEPSNMLVGYKEELENIRRGLMQVEKRNIILVGRQGTGKSATVEKFAYDQLKTKKPAIIVRLVIESLGALPENTMVSRMESLADDLRKIEYASLIENFDNYETIDVTDWSDFEINHYINYHPKALICAYTDIMLKDPKIDAVNLSEKTISLLMKNNNCTRVKSDILHLNGKEIDLSDLEKIQIETLLKSNPTAVREKHDILQLNSKKLNIEMIDEDEVEKITSSNEENVLKVVKSIVFNEKFDLILFIDEVHKLNNYGKRASGKKGSSGAMNAVKESLARGKAKLIVATTDYEYSANLAADTAIERRFSMINIKEPTDQETVLALRRHLEDWQEKIPHIPDVSDDILSEIATLTSALISEQPQPSKSIDILDTIMGNYLLNYEVYGKTLEINHNLIAQAFSQRGIDIDLKFDSRKIEKVLTRRVKGQPMAVRTIMNAIRRGKYTIRDYRKPIMTLLFPGTTGIGKTETVKALAEGCYGREDAVLTLNGGDYLTPEAVNDATRFIGDNVQTNKSQIILLDEIEKADKSMAKACMRLIDDGIVRDSNDVERSLSTCIIIATSNLGAEQIAKSAEVMNLDRIKNQNDISLHLEEQWQNQSMNIVNALTTGNKGENNGLPAELLQRFSVVPFFPLQKTTFATITNIKLNKFVEEERRLGYDVRLPAPMTSEEWAKYGRDFSDYNNVDIVSIMIAVDMINTDAKKIGARAVNEYIKNVVEAKVSLAIDYRKENNLDTSGYFTINTNGHSTVEDSTLNRPSVVVTYTDSNKKVWFVDEYHHESSGEYVYRDVTGLSQADIWSTITQDEFVVNENKSNQEFSTNDFFENWG